MSDSEAATPLGGPALKPPSRSSNEVRSRSPGRSGPPAFPPPDLSMLRPQSKRVNYNPRREKHLEELRIRSQNKLQAIEDSIAESTRALQETLLAGVDQSALPSSEAAELKSRTRRSKTVTDVTALDSADNSSGSALDGSSGLPSTNSAPSLEASPYESHHEEEEEPTDMNSLESLRQKIADINEENKLLKEQLFNADTLVRQHLQKRWSDIQKSLESTYESKRAQDLNRELQLHKLWKTKIEALQQELDTTKKDTAIQAIRLEEQVIAAEFEKIQMQVQYETKLDDLTAQLRSAGLAPPAATNIQKFVGLKAKTAQLIARKKEVEAKERVFDLQSYDSPEEARSRQLWRSAVRSVLEVLKYGRQSVSSASEAIARDNSVPRSSAASEASSGEQD